MDTESAIVKPDWQARTAFDPLHQLPPPPLWIGRDGELAELETRLAAGGLARAPRRWPFGLLHRPSGNGRCGQDCAGRQPRLAARTALSRRPTIGQSPWRGPEWPVPPHGGDRDANRNSFVSSRAAAAGGIGCARAHFRFDPAKWRPGAACCSWTTPPAWNKSSPCFRRRIAFCWSQPGAQSTCRD